MAERQAAHRQQMEQKAFNTESRDSLLGLLFAFVLGIGTIISGVVLAIFANVWAGTFIGSVGLVCLTGVFVYGTRVNKRK